MENNGELVRLMEVADEAAKLVDVDELIEVIELCSREQAESGSPSRFLDPTKHELLGCLTSPCARL